MDQISIPKVTIPLGIDEVYATDPRPFDQLVLVRQKSLNDTFTNLWRNTQYLKRMNETLNSDQPTCQSRSIDTTLLAPEVAIMVTANQPHPFKYTMRFGTGNMKGKSTSNPEKSWKTDGWVLVFYCDLAFTDELDPNSNPKTYTEYAANRQLPAGAIFSLRKLYLNIASIDQLIHEECSFGSYGNYQQLGEGSGILLGLLQVWLTNTDNQIVAAISMTTKNPSSVNPQAPTFPPTTVAATVYPWLDPNSGATQGTDGHDNNALAYLIMTQHRPMPSPATLKYSGCYVWNDPNQSIKLSISAEQFWKEWFCPNAQPINAAAMVNCLDPTMTLNWNLTNRVQKVFPQYVLGTASSHPHTSDDYYAWTWNPTPMSQDRWVTLATWASGTNSSTGQKGDNVLGGPGTLKADEDCNTTSTVSVLPGTANFRVTGVSHVHSHVYRHGRKDPGHGSYVNSEADMAFDSNWAIDLSVGALGGTYGGLTIFDTNQTSADQPFKVIINVTESSYDHINLNGGHWGDWARDVQQQLTDNMQTMIGGILGPLQQALNKFHQFFTPTTGEFIPSHAHFNMRGDLMITLVYNGAQ